MDGILSWRGVDPERLCVHLFKTLLKTTCLSQNSKHICLNQDIWDFITQPIKDEEIHTQKLLNLMASVGLGIDYQKYGKHCPILVRDRSRQNKSMGFVVFYRYKRGLGTKTL